MERYLGLDVHAASCTLGRVRFGATWRWMPLEQALHARPELENLVHHSDRGVQYLSIRYTERLDEVGIDPGRKRRRLIDRTEKVVGADMANGKEEN